MKLTDAPVAAAVLRIQPTRGIFEPYNILREGEVLNHLAGTAVPVPGVLASESDPRFFGAPFLLLESIDAAHVPARADRFPGGRRSQRGGRSAPDTRSSASTTRP